MDLKLSDYTFFTVADLSHQIGRTERTIREAIKRGDIPAHKVCGRWVIDYQELKEGFKKEESKND